MDVVVELCSPDGGVVAAVALPGRETFWSDGAFTPGPAYPEYADFFRDLRAASRRFDEAVGAEEVEALATLAELWIELNHLHVRERGAPGRLEDVGLLLDGDRARMRCYWTTAEDPLSEARLDALEALVGAGDRELAAAARTYLPLLIAEVRRGRAHT